MGEGMPASSNLQGKSSGNICHLADWLPGCLGNEKLSDINPITQAGRQAGRRCCSGFLAALPSVCVAPPSSAFALSVSISRLKRERVLAF